METNGSMIIIAILAFVILINVGLVFGFLRKTKSKPKIVFRESIGEMLNPWKKEDAALEELHQRVGDLKNGDRDAT